MKMLEYLTVEKSKSSNRRGV